MTGDRLDDFLAKAQVVSDEEAERADFVVCPPLGPSPFSDNVEAVCCACGCAVMHRPHAPKTPPRICVDCAMAKIGHSQ